MAFPLYFSLAFSCRSSRSPFFPLAQIVAHFNPFTTSPHSFHFGVSGGGTARRTAVRPGVNPPSIPYHIPENLHGAPSKGYGLERATPANLVDEIKNDQMPESPVFPFLPFLPLSSSSSSTSPLSLRLPLVAAILDRESYATR